MSLTKGMGEHWGSYLAAEPFRFRFKRIIKKIIEVIRRWIPWLRRRTRLKVQVTGSPVIHFKNAFTVQGNPFVVRSIRPRLLGNPVLKSVIGTRVLGSVMFSSTANAPITGSISQQVSQSCPLIGNLSHSSMISVELSGKKDFRILFELIDDLDED